MGISLKAEGDVLLKLIASLVLIVLGAFLFWYLGPPVNTTFTDCFWSAELHAFVDANRNRSRDKDEQPLQGVRFQVDDLYNDYTDVGRVVADDTAGSATALVWLPGCPKAEFEVAAHPPEGYDATTPSRLLDSARKITDEPFEFGFVPMEQVIPQP